MSKIFSPEKIVFLLLMFCAATANAQSTLGTKSKKAIAFYVEADNFRVRGQYSEALRLLHQALEKDDEFEEAYHRIGVVYLTLKNYTEAVRYFEKGLSLTQDPKKQKMFWSEMSEAYFNLGRYDDAEKAVTSFLNAETANRQRIEKAKNLKANLDFVRANQTSSTGFQQKVLSDTVNRFVMQYFPVLTADQEAMIFTRREGHSDNYDEDLVITKKNSRGQWMFPESVSKNINTPYNEGTCTISADGRKLIFTSCTGRDGYGDCDLYESTKEGSEWSIPVNLGTNINSSDWESQPTLSADGRTLYFISDRRGSVGRRDIWYSTLNSNGSWTRAKNIGAPINTIYDEYSPFIHVNNRVLYFASNGLTGFGGYDLFYSERDSSGWMAPVNVGAPINNHEDQYSLYITADGTKGYYSLEENIGQGRSTSKIVELSIPEDHQLKIKSNYVKGIVRDKATRQPLKANIELINIANGELQSLVTSDSVNGEYLIVLNEGAEYGLYVSKEGYLFKSMHFNYSEKKHADPITVNIDLERLVEGSAIVLENIFFDTDKYELKEKSLVELERLTTFLQNNPKLRIEISGHTDNVGADEYNKQLSEKRARAVSTFLINNGIDATRLLVKGYGAEKPVADNTSEMGRQQNRRIEFRLI